MQTLEFLEKILPSSGYYVNTIINKDGNKQGFFDNIEDLAKSCIRLDRTNNNTYFAISAFDKRAIQSLKLSISKRKSSLFWIISSVVISRALI